MDEERDLITVTDEEGNETLMEILDYFEHQGREYALLTEADLPEDAEAEVTIMEIIANDEDETEEVVSIEDEVLFEELSGIAEEIIAQWNDELEED